MNERARITCYTMFGGGGIPGTCKREKIPRSVNKVGVVWFPIAIYFGDGLDMSPVCKMQRNRKTGTADHSTISTIIHSIQLDVGTLEQMVESAYDEGTTSITQKDVDSIREIFNRIKMLACDTQPTLSQQSKFFSLSLSLSLWISILWMNVLNFALN